MKTAFNKSEALADKMDGIMETSFGKGEAL